MSINAEQLEKDINAIPGICPEGKEAIKKLFTNNFDVKFENLREPRPSEIWQTTRISGYKIPTIILGNRKGVTITDGKHEPCLSLQEINAKNYRDLKFLAKDLRYFYTGEK